jgi:hypothetical protein
MVNSEKKILKIVAVEFGVDFPSPSRGEGKNILNLFRLIFVKIVV